MADLFAGGHLRFINGEWRDDNGDPVEIAEVVRCKDCFANDCCSIQIDLNMGGEGYCPKGRKEDRC